MNALQHLIDWVKLSTCILGLDMDHSIQAEMCILTQLRVCRLERPARSMKYMTSLTGVWQWLRLNGPKSPWSVPTHLSLFTCTDVSCQALCFSPAASLFVVLCLHARTFRACCKCGSIASGKRSTTGADVVACGCKACHAVVTFQDGLGVSAAYKLLMLFSKSRSVSQVQGNNDYVQGSSLVCFPK